MTPGMTEKTPEEATQPMNQLAQAVTVITIDGPSGSGKGTITHRLAQHLGFHILDSGALYRLVGLAARQHETAFNDPEGLSKIATELDVVFAPTDDAQEPLQVRLEGQDVTLMIRTDQAGTDASQVAKVPAVRDALIERQRAFAQAPGLVADGRDMGTVVFTNAVVKIYLTASAEARAERRYKQLKDKGMGVSLHDLFLSIQARDDQDMNRAVAPLKPAADAVIVDSTDMPLDAVFEAILNGVNAVLNR